MMVQLSVLYITLLVHVLLSTSITNLNKNVYAFDPRSRSLQTNYSIARARRTCIKSTGSHCVSLWENKRKTKSARRTAAALVMSSTSSDDEVVVSLPSSRMENFQTTKSARKKGEEKDEENSELTFQFRSPNTPTWAESTGWRMVIVVLCALWGSNFAVAKLVMSEPGVDSSLYAISRFGISAAALAPFAIKSIKDNDDEAVIDVDVLKQAIVCGSFVSFGYIGQTLGLMTTTSSKSCVICSMHCVFVAIVAEIMRVRQVRQADDKRPTSLLRSSSSSSEDCSNDNKYNDNNNSNNVENEKNEENINCNTKFDAKKLLPAAVAVLGVAIIELKGAAGTATIGDAISFAQPIGFGAGYLILEDIMAKKPSSALVVSFVKLSVVTFFSFLLFVTTQIIISTKNGGGMVMLLPNFTPILESNVATAGILYTGLITTALALWIESVAFAKVPATDASLILTTEPIFAAVIGAVALGESFGTSDYVGAAFIVGACVLSIAIGSGSQISEEETVEPESTTTAAVVSADLPAIDI